MEELKFDSVCESRGVDLRCRDDCPCHCVFAPLIEKGILLSPEDYK